VHRISAAGAADSAVGTSSATICPLCPGRFVEEVAWCSPWVLGSTEELVFRLIAFHIAHILLVDMLRMEKKWAYLGIVVAQQFFLLYTITGPLIGRRSDGPIAFSTICRRLFWNSLITRGFGITAGTHGFMTSTSSLGALFWSKRRNYFPTFWAEMPL